jgi:DNA-3-methyladenine glycosylase II
MQIYFYKKIYLLTENKIKTLLESDDEILHQIIQTLPPPSFISTKNVFHDLMSCLIEQQIHYRSTKKIFSKLLTKAGITHLTTDNFEQLEESGLASCSLSMKKYEAIHEAHLFFQQQKINWEETSDKVARAHLTNLKGVSHWTANMILLYTLRRPNIVPISDYHLKQIMSKLYGFSPSRKVKKSIEAIAQQWSPYQSLAVLYLLDWKSFHKTR